MQFISVFTVVIFSLWIGSFIVCPLKPQRTDFGFGMFPKMVAVAERTAAAVVGWLAGIFIWAIWFR